METEGNSLSRCCLGWYRSWESYKQQGSWKGSMIWRIERWDDFTSKQDQVSFTHNFRRVKSASGFEARDYHETNRVHGQRAREDLNLGLPGYNSPTLFLFSLLATYLQKTHSGFQPCQRTAKRNYSSVGAINALVFYNWKIDWIILQFSIQFT